MKARDILIAIVGTLILPAYFASCGVDRWERYAGETETDRWIDDTMRVWYYWAEEIPNTNSLNYFQAPFTFFSKLLSKQDKFSYIDSLSSATTATRSIPYTDYSYGMEFATTRVTIEGEGTFLYALVLYVADGTPASEAGLKRGDWIMQMDGEYLTDKSCTNLYGGGAVEIVVGYYDAERNTVVPYDTPRRMASARPIDDNPVHYYNVYTSGTKRIGYLVYNHFTAGPVAGSYDYDNRLRSVFSLFASQQVNEFILDLRYNNGGLLSCAQLLCTLLAPSSALGQPLGYLEYNSRQKPQIAEFSLNPDLIGNGANLNLSTLYVLTGTETASASEMVINCLSPYMNVVVVGSTTVGKNMGALTFDNPEQMITMSPLVCKIYNAEGMSDYESGFMPQYGASETADISRFLPFGDPDEALLNTALGVILGIGEESGDPDVSARLQVAPVGSSIARRGGVVRIK